VCFQVVLPSLKQNLMQIRCSFTSVILAGRYDHKTALTRRRKKMHRKNTRPHSRIPLGRVVHEGHSSRCLAAHNCPTSGFRAAFLFRGLFGLSTTYIRACTSDTTALRVIGSNKIFQEVDYFDNLPFPGPWKGKSFTLSGGYISSRPGNDNSNGNLLYAKR